jgi:hopene-associated glycosyltransferase HpnB
MISIPLILAVLSLAVWVYLVAFRGRFWRCEQRLDLDAPPPPAAWPEIVAVVPARDEADVIERSLSSLLEQDYPGAFSVVLVDDGSGDGTGDIARRLGAAHRNGARLTVVQAPPLPEGWAGKMWAVATGIGRADQDHPAARYLWLTDADISHAPHVLRALAARAEAGGLDLTSVMALLHCKSAWERLLIPAFVYFFQKLYPFPRVNDPADGLAGAAGGCMLVRRTALKAAGGIEKIRSAVIDDCALARELKRGGPIWLGLSRDVRSTRPYAGLAGIWKMVARSAYDQLGYSPAMLAGAVAGMLVVYLAPPFLVLAQPWHGDYLAASLGAAAWVLMGFSYIPTLWLYRQKPVLGLLLPLAGVLYDLMTLDSALAYYRGRGAYWKGRAQAPKR